MEKFDKLETTNSVDNIKPESETKTINQEDYVKKQQEREEEEYYDKLKEDWTPDDIDNKLMADFELAQTIPTKYYVSTKAWPNTDIISPAQRITNQSKNMEIPQ